MNEKLTYEDYIEQNGSLTYTNVGGGSSRRNDWLRHYGSGSTDGKAPLYRL